MDMYESQFKAKGIFNAEVGMAYRKKILASKTHLPSALSLC